MAEKKTGPTFDSIMRSLKEQRYAPVYILMGEESFFIDKITDYIAENIVPVEERDFNQMILFGADTNTEQVAMLAKEYPMMAERRVVIVKEAQALKNMDALEKYLDKPSPTTVLVLCFKNGTVDRRKKWVSKAEAVGVVFDSKKKRETELPAFIEGYVRLKKMGIDPKATAMLADHIGSDLARIASELDKVSVALSNREQNITPDIIERLVGVSKDFNTFELRKAIINKDVFKANQIVNYFDNNPKAGSIYSILPTLFSYFQNLMMAYYAPDKSRPENIASFLDLKSVWSVTDYITGMKNFKPNKTLQIISKIRDIDAKSKGINNPNTTEKELMQELIFFILH